MGSIIAGQGPINITNAHMAAARAEAYGEEMKEDQARIRLIVQNCTAVYGNLRAAVLSILLDRCMGPNGLIRNTFSNWPEWS